MTRAIAIPAVAYLAMCAAMFACSESALVPEDEAPDTDAAVTSALSQLDAGASAGANSMSSGGQASAPPASSGGQDSKFCPYDEASKSFECPTKTATNGMTHDMFFQLLDAANNPQAQFDTATTVSIRRVTDRAGTFTQNLMTQNGPVPTQHAITEHQDMMLTGLRTMTPEQNGTGTMRAVLDRSDRPPPGDTIEVSQTFSKIFIDPAPTAPKYPKSGTVTAQFVNKLGDGTKHSTSQVTTYDGSTIAKTVITLPNGTTRTCTYDMTAKAPGPPNCTTP